MIDNYKIVREAISKELAQFVYEYFLMKRQVARKFFDDRFESGRIFMYVILFLRKHPLT